MPGTVIIPAGRDFVTFGVSVRDDSFAEEPVVAQISADAFGHVFANDTFSIFDNDLPALSLVLDDASISENGGATTATVTRNTSTASSLAVSLEVSDASEASAPPSVTIPAGQSSTTFTVSAEDDSFIDGDQTVRITASASTLSDGVASLDVLDDDTIAAALTLTLDDAAISENGGATTATVTRNTDTSLPLTVVIANTDASEISAPPQVTIAAGQSSATFTVSAQNDSLNDGDQTAQLLVTAEGFQGADAEVTILDDDVQVEPPEAADDPGFSTPTLQTVFIRFEELLANDGGGDPTGLSVVGFDNPHPTLAGNFFSDGGALFTIWNDTAPVTDIAEATQILYGPPPAPAGSTAFTGVDSFAYTIERDGGGAAQASATVTVATAPDVVEDQTTTDDILIGSDLSERIYGEFGDDLILARDGDDIVFGFTGNERIFGGEGFDRLDGELGNDLLVGGAGIDYLYGDGFSAPGVPNGAPDGADLDDILYGGEGLDAIFGGFGNDTFVLTASSDEEQVFDWNEGDKIAVQGASGLGDLTITTDAGTNNIRVIRAGTDGSDSMLIVSATPLPALDADDFDFDFDFSQLTAPELV